ncbi:hypothetical protein E4U60_000523 [Claviceps pazoutovae]|uniref:Uncharacterized protein n=1 Tax=Claviceps pazoutovae TaxID=1649127 RepID=A0A9P7SIG4_9HYPO|nr:hypothetical protein E4U60_000523 [Claviceps pazoutovae]
MAIAPITGKQKLHPRAKIIANIIKVPDYSSPTSGGSRYGFHIPRTNLRDDYYVKLEAERIEARKQ